MTQPTDDSQPDTNQAESVQPDPGQPEPGQPDPSQDATKDPEDWVTGDEAMTGPQRSYLQTLAREGGEELPDDLTKAQASEHIDRLQQKTGRGA